MWYVATKAPSFSWLTVDIGGIGRIEGIGDTQLVLSAISCASIPAKKDGVAAILY